jgi:hypothetical protein|tara:strand:- start:68 stop:466 length:399 start_codon:yes stop_codon:yes gene_type:complete
MKTYQDLLQDLEVVKSEGHPFTELGLYFNESSIFIAGKLRGKGKIRGGKFGEAINVFIPTSKGYMSSEWKKTEFYKMGFVELTEELFNKLSDFIIIEAPKHFIRKTEGWGVAGAVANHINSKVDYTSNKMRQ